MQHTENWIWLPETKYPHNQTTVYSGFLKKTATNYTVAEFAKSYTFSTKVTSAAIRFSGDTLFQFFCNDNIIATGPACVGGDFINNDTPRNSFYSFETTIYPNKSTLDFFARVQMMPYHMCDYSQGHGGFMMSAILTFEDGRKESICTDSSWLVRKNGAYIAPKVFDGRIAPDAFTQAESTPNIWNTTTAPIPVREEQPLSIEISLLPNEEKTIVWELDKIWGGFLQVQTQAQGEVSLQIMCRESDEKALPDELYFVGNQTYRGFCMHSAGSIEIHAINHATSPAQANVCFIKTHYPVSEEATTTTSDAALNLVLETCKHTLKICRQTHHLDSTSHCEPTACPGDYYIESLMTPFSFGDMRLAEFDLKRIAIMLQRENGRMFHTTYSLIWVKMLYDVYMFTGNTDLLQQCENALNILLKRFEAYVGDNGIIDDPPNYMFVDWIYVDGFTLHHPPAALGQSCMNMFYFGALDCAEKIYRILGAEQNAQCCLKQKEALRHAINRHLFDLEKGCYFEGLNIPNKPEHRNGWLPDNTQKQYYLKHSNILACYFGICDDETGKNLIHRIMTEEIEGDCQPYFLHYLLEAVYRLGLREKYTLQICNRWKESVQQCSKGLVEGFVPPEPGYHFDHSHAWGGTPLYSLPKAMMGLEIKKAGMQEISLAPSLLGLQYGKAELLTPYGKVTCELKEGADPCITHPQNVKVILR